MSTKPSQLQFEPLVEIVGAAVGDFVGDAPLFVSSLNHGDHRMWDGAVSTSRETRTAKQIRVTTLDELLGTWGKIDLLKIDIQGYEPAAIHGMRHKLELQSVAVMFMEFWPEGLRTAGFDPKQFLLTLEGFGFKAWSVLASGLAPVSINIIDELAGHEYANLFLGNPMRAREKLTRLGLA